jgi:hypothetical protein
MMGELDQLRPKTLRSDPSLMLESDYHKRLANEDFPPAPWVSIFEHFAKYERLYRALLGEKGSSWFRKKMRNYLANVVSERVEGVSFHQNANPLSEQRIFQEGFVPMLLAGQMLDSISWWLEHDRPYPPKQIAGYCHRLIIASLREANTWE